jgi:hypothetical protein
MSKSAAVSALSVRVPRWAVHWDHVESLAHHVQSVLNKIRPVARGILSRSKAMIGWRCQPNTDVSTDARQRIPKELRLAWRTLWL